MTLHWGPTQFPGCLRFFQGTISTKSWKQDCYFGSCLSLKLKGLGDDSRRL